MTRTTPFWVPLDEYFSWKKCPIDLNAQTLTCWKEKAGSKPCEGSLIPNISLGEISKDCVKFTFCVHVCWNIIVLLCQLMCILSPQTWDCNDKYEWSACVWGGCMLFTESTTFAFYVACKNIALEFWNNITNGREMYVHTFNHRCSYLVHFFFFRVPRLHLSYICKLPSQQKKDKLLHSNIPVKHFVHHLRMLLLVNIHLTILKKIIIITQNISHLFTLALYENHSACQQHTHAQAQPYPFLEWHCWQEECLCIPQTLKNVLAQHRHLWLKSIFRSSVGPFSRWYVYVHIRKPLRAEIIKIKSQILHYGMRLSKYVCVIMLVCIWVMHTILNGIYDSLCV